MSDTNDLEYNYLDEQGLTKLVGNLNNKFKPTKRACYEKSPALYAHSEGDIICFEEHLYTVTEDIDVGDTITDGDNIESYDVDKDTQVYIENLPGGGGGGQQTAIIALSATTASVDNATSTATITMTTNSDGTPSVSSSDTDVATASISNNTITITGVGRGTATVTVSIPATSSYTAATATIDVTSNVWSITIGDTYFFGGFYWTAAEDLGNNAVCMQSQGMTAGTWPGYKLTSDYSGSKSYGNANAAYNSNIDGDNIANYDEVTQAWYSKYSAVEKTGQAYGSGLFLVSNTKCNQTTPSQQGSGNYWKGLKTAASNYSSFGAGGGSAWLGTVYSTSGCWCIESNGNVGRYNDIQQGSNVIAPAFNLDLTKVKLIPGTGTNPDSIILLNESIPEIVTWASGTDAKINAMVEAANNGIIDLGMYWSVGEERTISISSITADTNYVKNDIPAQSSVWVLLDKKYVKRYRRTSGTIRYGQFIIGMKGTLASKIRFGNDSTIMAYGESDPPFLNWGDASFSSWINTKLRDAIPSSIKDIFKEVSVYYEYCGASKTSYYKIEYVNNYFFPPTREEIGIGASAETNVLKYYETAANRIKNSGTGTADYCYLRSLIASNDRGFDQVTYEGTYYQYQRAYNYGYITFQAII